MTGKTRGLTAAKMFFFGALAFFGGCLVWVATLPNAQDPQRIKDATTPVTRLTVPAEAIENEEPAEQITQNPNVIAGDGMYLVGDDFKAGTYRTTSPVSECYWAKYSDSEGDDIIANDFVNGGRPQVILKKGQWFKTSDCGTWEKK